jgi:hypothetical protein
MKLSSRKELLAEADAELKKLKKSRKLIKEDEGDELMDVVATIRTMSTRLKNLDQWLRGDPAFVISTGNIDRMWKAFGDDFETVSKFIRTEIDNRKNYE